MRTVYEKLDEELRKFVPLDDDLIWVDYDHRGLITRVRRYLPKQDEVLSVDVYVISVNMGFMCMHRFQGGAYGTAFKHFDWLVDEKFVNKGVRLVKRMLKYKKGGSYKNPFYKK